MGRLSFIIEAAIFVYDTRSNCIWSSIIVQIIIIWWCWLCKNIFTRFVVLGRFCPLVLCIWSPLLNDSSSFTLNTKRCWVSIIDGTQWILLSILFYLLNILLHICLFRDLGFNVQLILATVWLVGVANARALDTVLLESHLHCWWILNWFLFHHLLNGCLRALSHILLLQHVLWWMTVLFLLR